MNMSEENKILSINSLDTKTISNALNTWSGHHSGVVGSSTLDTASITSSETHRPYIGDPLHNRNAASVYDSTNNCTITNYPYFQPNYWNPTYTWLSYGTDKLLITKAENGFILSYNTKVYLAKNEKELSKLIVKMMSPNKTNKEK
jgi:hypothetical protein